MIKRFTREEEIPLFDLKVGDQGIFKRSNWKNWQAFKVLYRTEETILLMKSFEGNFTDKKELSLKLTKPTDKCFSFKVHVIANPFQKTWQGLQELFRR